MKLQAALSLLGALVGILLLFVYPELLGYSFQYSTESREALNPSMVAGTPAALAVLLIPFLLGTVGFISGYIINKIRQSF